MNLNEIIDFIKEENQRLEKKYKHVDKEKRIYAETVKVMEEVGELSNAILLKHKQQRRQKLQNNSGEISNEIADVLITTMILAEIMDVDIEDALKTKIAKVKARY